MATNLVEEISTATQDDLDAINKRIKELDSMIKDFVAAKKAERDALKLIRKCLEIRLNGKAITKRTPKSEQVIKPKLSDKIKELIHANGPMPTFKIASMLNKTTAVIAMSIGRSKELELKDGLVSIITRLNGATKLYGTNN